MTYDPNTPNSRSSLNTTPQKPKSGITSSFTTFFTKLHLRKANEKHGKPRPSTNEPNNSNTNTERPDQIYKDRKWQRAQRRSHRESEDYLGVVGANPDTGLFDVLSPVESSGAGSTEIKEGSVSSSGSNSGYRNGKILGDMIKGRGKERSEWIGDLLLQNPLRVGLGGRKYWGLMSEEAKRGFGRDSERMRTTRGQKRVVDDGVAKIVGVRKLSGEMMGDEKWEKEQDHVLKHKHDWHGAVVERLEPPRQPHNSAREESRAVRNVTTTNKKDSEHTSEMIEIKRTPRNLRDLESTGTVIRTPQKASTPEEKLSEDSTSTPPKKLLPSTAREMPIILETNTEPKLETLVPERQTSPAVHIHHHHHYHYYWIVDRDGKGSWRKKSGKMDDVLAPTCGESQFDTRSPENEVVKGVVKDGGPKDNLGHLAHEKKGTFGSTRAAAVNVSAFSGIGVPIVRRRPCNSRTRRHRRSFR